MCLFHFSTCFQQPSAHHQENQLYQYIIWYVSPTHSDIYQMMYWYNWFFWWWALCCSKQVEKRNKHIKNCVKLVIKTNWGLAFKLERKCTQKTLIIWPYTNLHLLLPKALNNTSSWFKVPAEKYKRYALFWGIMQRTVVLPYRRFGTTFLSHLQVSRNTKRNTSRNVGKDLPLYAA